MMPKKPIVVSKNGEYVTTIMGISETAEYCGLHPVTVANMYKTGKVSRKGYAFDRPLDYEETVNSFVSQALTTAEQGHENIGKLCWFGLYKSQLQRKVRDRSMLNASRLLESNKYSQLPFMDARGAWWKYAVVCPEDFVKRYLHGKQ